MIANRVRMSKIDKGWDGIFADPEVGRVLKYRGLIADANKSSIEELATITSLANVFKDNKVITQFPELQYCTGLTDLYYTFGKCTSLTKAPVIPSSVTRFTWTFYGCTSIDGIYIINIVTPPTYESTLSNVHAIYVPDESVDTYKSASGWSEFADRIFPMSDMGDYIVFADSAVGRVLKAKGLIADANRSSIEELATITSLGSYFYNNKGITKFPELQYCTGLTSLESAFGSCSNLTTVGDIIPEGVTNLNETFNWCTSLTKAPVIPSSVTDLSQTFRYCRRIDGIFTIEAVSPPTYSNTFVEVNVRAIYVPDESVDTYKSASGWSSHASRIYPMSELPE